MGLLPGQEDESPAPSPPDATPQALPGEAQRHFCPHKADTLAQEGRQETGVKSQRHSLLCYGPQATGLPSGPQFRHLEMKELI